VENVRIHAKIERILARILAKIERILARITADKYC